MSWKKHLVSVPQGAKLQAAINQLNKDLASQSPASTSSKYLSYLPEVYAGQPNRLERYTQYDNMDKDPEVNAAIDTIADFATQGEEHHLTPFKITYNNDPTESESEVLNEALNKWVKLNKFKQKIWRIFRSTIMYGDQFFVRDPETFRWLWINHQKIESITVNEAEGKQPQYYNVYDLDLNLQTIVATLPTLNPNRGMSGWAGGQQGTSKNPGPVLPPSGSQLGMYGAIGQHSSSVDANHVIHLSLSEGIDANWPFGNSILEAVFKPFKQKELLEDSIIIYRVQRAPERRVFYIDVGNAPTHKAMEFVNRIKNEIHQRRIPSQTGGGACISLDTEIPLLDGRTLPLQKIIEEYEVGKNNWVYSCNPESGEIIPSPITWAGITRRSTQVIRLTLDNGEEIVCTPDHKIPTLNRGKIEAQNIVINEDSLISFNTRMYSINKPATNKVNQPQYEQIYNHNTRCWEFTHKVVGNFFKKLNNHNSMTYDDKYLIEDATNLVIHHVDLNKYNNHPDNLFFMHPIDHFKMHGEQSRKYWDSLTESELEIKKELISKKSTAAWQLFKKDKKRYNQWTENQRINTKEFIKNNKRHKELLLKNIKEQQKKPFPNQKIVFSDKMMNILEEITIHHYDGDICSLLSNNSDFMDDYKLLNPRKEGTYNKLVYDRFTKTTLIRMLNAYGYDSWRNYVTTLGLKIKKPSRKLKWDARQLSIIIDLVKQGITSTNSIVNLINNNQEFMSLHNTLNKSVKGTASNIHFSQNTLKVLVSDFGFRNWSDFKEKSSMYNHKVVKIEWLDEKIDTGTITVDGQEKFSNFHTFATKSGVFIFNSIMDAAYNPLAILEDYFFPQTADGRGSKVETLPGGENLGEIDDLKYFNNKLLRGLRVPPSYLPFGPDDTTAVTYTDGRVGTAYMQEFRFAKYVKRLQTLLNPVFDLEFKLFLRHKGIQIDSSLFELELHEPQNFSKFRQLEIDAAQINTFQPLAEVKYFSKRFLMERFLNMTPDEIARNEKLWAAENPNKTKASSGDSIGSGGNVADMGGLGDVGVRPGAEGSSEDLGGEDLGGEDLGGESPISGDEAGADITSGADEGDLEI